MIVSCKLDTNAKKIMEDIGVTPTSFTQQDQVVVNKLKFNHITDHLNGQISVLMMTTETFLYMPRVLQKVKCGGPKERMIWPMFWSKRLGLDIHIWSLRLHSRATENTLRLLKRKIRMIKSKTLKLNSRNRKQNSKMPKRAPKMPKHMRIERLSERKNATPTFQTTEPKSHLLLTSSEPELNH